MFQDFITYLEYGFNHIISFNGYDHILFLLILTVPYAFKDWKRVFILITVFTVGHTVSLVLSVYNLAQLSSRLVEFLIPLTILIGGIYNVFTAGKKAKQHAISVLLLVAAFFGLIHGLSFASGFTSILNSGDNKIVSLLEFGLGVELGQIIAVFLILFLGFLGQTIFRFSTRDWVMVVSAIVIGLILPMILKSSYLS